MSPDATRLQILVVPTLMEMFDASLRGRAPQMALEYERSGGGFGTLTFGEVDARADAMARTLAGRGLRVGDRCVVHLANCVEFIDLFLACLRLGVIFVPVNVLYRDRELTHIVADSDPTLIVTSAEHLSLFGGDTRGVAIESFESTTRATGVGPGMLAAEHAEHTDTATETATTTATTTATVTTTATATTWGNGDDSAPAVIIYTSGTTGKAKGAVLSRGNLAANASNLVAAWRITADDRYLAVLPLFHVHGLGNGICSWLASGCVMRLVERFDVTRVAAWFAEFRPTLMFGVPTVYVRMLDLPANVTHTMGDAMRLFVSGSAPLPAQVHADFAARFGQTILERYGMSETLMNIGNPYDGERRPGSVGFPFANVQARIVDESGAAVPTATAGQLEVRGPNVFASYWQNDEATARSFRDGWFRTGDMAEVSADGYYTLRGRASDLIISGGFNIYPREIEELLLDQPAVREAAVVGAPDERRGEVVIAYIVVDADAGTTDDSLRAACAKSLASFKTPRAFIRVQSLPRTALGKIQKHLLPKWDGG